ncbi:ABC transporter ATP-binding protein [Devosia sp. A369]
MSKVSDLNASLESKHAVRLNVENLSVAYRTARGPFYALDKISFSVDPARTLGLVGESGCGKSTVVKALMRLLPEGTEVGGRVLLDDIDLLALDKASLNRLRWSSIALVTQSAMNSLDPVYTIGDQIVESIRTHMPVTRGVAWKRAEEMFALVGLPAARLHEFPHQFSGGMRQRAVIAMAMSLNAGLLLADEPTTALDPIMQDQIMGRIKALQKRLHRSMVLVTHDIAVVAETCNDVAVMYAGTIVERGPVRDVLTAPLHPYTMGLRNAFPMLPKDGEEKRPLIWIAGRVPNLLAPPKGCRFASRCPFATELCRNEAPQLQGSEAHVAACHYPQLAVEFRQRAAQASTWKNMERHA